MAPYEAALVVFFFFFPIKIKRLNHSSAAERTPRGLGPTLTCRCESAPYC